MVPYQNQRICGNLTSRFAVIATLVVQLEGASRIPSGSRKNYVPVLRVHFKRKGLSSNHFASGDMLVVRGVLEQALLPPFHSKTYDVLLMAFST